MARGWESKSVEDQLDDFRQRADKAQKQSIAPQDAEVSRQRNVLILARSRILGDLEVCKSPRREEQLRQALAEIEAQLELAPAEVSSSAEKED